MAQKKSMYVQRENVAGQRCIAQGKEDIVREYKATHEENFLSSWLREEMDKESREEENRR